MYFAQYSWKGMSCLPMDFKWRTASCIMMKFDMNVIPVEGHLWRSSYYLTVRYNAVHFWWYCGHLLQDFHHQHFFLAQNIFVINFSAESVCLNLCGLFNECVCIHCFGCSLVSAFIYQSQVSSRYSVIEKFIIMFVVLFKGVLNQSQGYSLCFVCTHGQFQNLSLIQMLWQHSLW
jgi:hypothetical protein